MEYSACWKAVHSHVTVLVGKHPEGQPLPCPWTATKTLHCDRCQQSVLPENVLCERCNALPGYPPDVGEISAFEPADESTEIVGTGETLEITKAADKRWRSLYPKAQGQRYRQCHNYAVENVCNWMILVDSLDTLCRACQSTETIPDLNVPENRFY